MRRAMVVLPEPMGPWTYTGPTLSPTIYRHFASTSWCCGARNRNLGSGEIRNGASFNPKNSSYIDLLRAIYGNCYTIKLINWTNLSRGLYGSWCKVESCLVKLRRMTNCGKGQTEPCSNLPQVVIVPGCRL